MEIQVSQLTPGMVLQKDVVGKSGKPIVPKKTELTAEHITFIKKFLIEKVSVSPLILKNENNNQEVVENLIETSKQHQVLEYVFDMAVKQYKEIFQRVKNNLTIEMFKIREKWIPMFQEVAPKSIVGILKLMEYKSREDKFYTRNVIKTFLAVALVNKLGYEQKDLVQIGFAALLSDIGIASLKDDIGATKDENWRLHPIYSYKLIEKEVTLNKFAKLAILQQHEYLDGSGFPSGNKKDKIHPFSQIIAISDYVVTEYENNSLDSVIKLLNTYKNIKFMGNIVDTLIKELEANN